MGGAQRRRPSGRLPRERRLRSWARSPSAPTRPAGHMGSSVSPRRRMARVGATRRWPSCPPRTSSGRGRRMARSARASSTSRTARSRPRSRCCCPRSAERSRRRRLRASGYLQTVGPTRSSACGALTRFRKRRGCASWWAVMATGGRRPCGSSRQSATAASRSTGPGMANRSTGRRTTTRAKSRW